MANIKRLREEIENFHYYAIMESWSGGTKLDKVDVIQIIGVDKICEKLISKVSRDELIKFLSDELIYRCMSRAEYEIKVGGLFARDDFEFSKIDVWYQVEPNISVIADCLLYIYSLLTTRNIVDSENEM